MKPHVNNKLTFMTVLGMLVVVVITIYITACSEKPSTNDSSQIAFREQVRTLAGKHVAGDSAALESLRILLQGCVSDCNQNASVLVKIGSDYSDKGMLEESTGLFHLAIPLAQKYQDSKSIHDAQIELAWAYLNLGHTDSMAYYHDIMLKIPKNELDYSQKAAVLNIEAIMAISDKRYLESIEKFLMAYDLLQGKDSKQERNVLENIGAIYATLQSYKRAMSYYRRALPIYEIEQDTASLTGIYSNMGIALMGMDSLEAAAEHHQKALSLVPPGSFSEARSLANYGNVLRRQGKLLEAKSVIDSSLQLVQEMNIPFGIVLNKINLAQVMLDMKKPEEAVRLLKFVENQENFYTDQLQMEYYKISGQTYAQLGNMGKAYAFQQQYLEMKEKLQSQGAERLVMEWEERNWRAKKDAELAEKDLQLENARLKQRIIVFLSLILLMLSAAIGVIYILSRQRHRLNQQLLEEEKENIRMQLELKEREITSQSIHLQSISGFAEDISNKLTSLKGKLEENSADELQKIIKDFENGIPEELWDDFRLRFEQVNEDFHQKLLQLAPDLSPVEIKIASFLRLNLSSKEISRLTNRSSGTISNTRSSLRRKLKLDEEDNLVAFLLTL
jgi:tetratricopeptide (TPR) repeat protein/DNA-binding CsgD family transcriptional regulator